MPPRKRLGQLLTELKVIDDHQLQSALGHQRQWGGKLGAILVQKGFCGEEQLVSALAQHLNMERVKLGETKIDPRAVKLVSKQIAEKLHVFPYHVSGAGRSEVISIAMSDPTDLSAVDQLAFHTGKRIKPLLASDGEIVSAIQANYGATEVKKEATDKVARPPGSPAAAEDRAGSARRSGGCCSTGSARAGRGRFARGRRRRHGPGADRGALAVRGCGRRPGVPVGGNEMSLLAPTTSRPQHARR